MSFDKPFTARRPYWTGGEPARLACPKDRCTVRPWGLITINGVEECTWQCTICKKEWPQSQLVKVPSVAPPSMTRGSR